MTEQSFAGLADAPAALAPEFASAFRPEKRIRLPFNPRERWLTAAREACRSLSDAVRTSLGAGATCLILGGECTLVAGSLSGALEVEPDLLLLYLDAHGDFNTLATTPTHYVSGMCLAHVCGHRVAPLLWPGVRTIAEDRVVLAGARALDAGELGNLSRSRVLRVAFDAEQRDAPGLIAAIRRRPVWLHVDLDVVDPEHVPAVVFPAAGGPSLRDLEGVLAAVARVCDVRGVEICGYDPRKDAQALLPAVLARTFMPLLPAARPVPRPRRSGAGRSAHSPPIV
ncbi:MAG TPA: arginase family protein [Candidatus Limnocylindrales bacterium]|nr:arginase family protein [Candidatus Limnocylindrales bacterium]